MKKPVTRIAFVCHGNICRSPMAEFVMKDMAKRAGREDEFYIESRATHDDEIGNDTHIGTLRVLKRCGVPFAPRRATLLTRADANAFDLFVGMDDRNIRDMRRVLGADAQDKIRLMLGFTGEARSVNDPWYTGDFESTYRDITAGCAALLAKY